MGDYSATSLFSRTLTNPKPSTTTSNISSAAVTITTSTMQDDLLIEKQTTGKPAPLSPSGGLDTVAGQDKSKDVIEAENIAITPTTPSSIEKDITCSTTSALQGFADPGGRVPSLWSAPDDGGLHTTLPVNGSIAAFQNFPAGGPAGLFASTGAAAAVSTGTRRAITASHNFPQQQQQQHVASPGLSPWNRGRSVPNLPPLHSSLHAAAAVAAAAGLQGRKPSPTFPGHPGPAAAHPSCISPVKFRRSTSYPGKGNIYPPQPAPTFEVTAAEERDLLQLPPFQQDRMTANGNSPLDNMRTLEHYLSDIMRAGAADTPEHLKGMSHIFISCMQLR
ncbi:hypothetical protein ALC60_09450 [Trachymyrmex zeteki]|uniref:Uncharacterized protein n=1 Tax=Mycetomoellerius zeteki TaxID=64791 RepID=A0A151WU36_9HYME|nr:hypothetical protein ALC60_09450 [Trachymyrmex zeteki]